MWAILLCSFTHEPLNSVFTHHPTFSHSFRWLSHSFPTFYIHTDSKYTFFSPPFSSFIFCRCNIFQPLSLSLFLLPSFSYIFLFTNRHTHTYASRQANRTIHPLQHWNCPQATLVRQHAVAFTSLLYTHIPPTPRLPPPRSKRCRPVRLPVSPSVYSQLPACQCLNWSNVRAFVYGGKVCFCDNLVPHIVSVAAVITVWGGRGWREDIFKRPSKKYRSWKEEGFEVTMFL